MARGFYSRVSIVNTLTDGLNQLEAAYTELAEKAVLEGAAIIAQQAHDNANVSAGERGHAKDGRHMRDCIEVALVDKPGTEANARVFIDSENVPYAVHQEFGPNGNAFMRRAVDETRDDVKEKMREVLAEAPARLHVRFRAVS